MTDDSYRRFFRARKTCCEMLEDRQYIISSQEKDEGYAEFLSRLESNGNQRSKMLLVGSDKDNPQRKIIVYFSDETKKTGVTPIKELTEKMEQTCIQNAILVTQQPLTHFARSAINAAAPQHIIEYFLESELLVNITKHDLVPKHIPLTEVEKEKLLERYRVKETQLPRIQITDPVTRYYGLTRGQVVKIIRPSETAGRYVTYRMVVA